MNYAIWTLVCFVLAVVFGLIELFVPTGGILAFLCAVAFLGSIAFAFLYSPIFAFWYSIGLMILIPLLLWYASILWPKTRMGRMILLDPDEDPALQPDAELRLLKSLVGKQGKALSRMMLSGQIEIDGRRLNALSQSEPIETGECVKVVKVDGIEILVQKVSSSESAPNVAIHPEPPSRNDAIEDPFA